MQVYTTYKKMNLKCCRFGGGQIFTQNGSTQKPINNNNEKLKDHSVNTYNHTRIPANMQ